MSYVDLTLNMSDGRVIYAGKIEEGALDQIGDKPWITFNVKGGRVKVNVAHIVSVTQAVTP